MKVLYRKYRPTRLSEVVGQEQVTKALLSSLKAGKISHAYLFIGPRGCGKTSVARILAHEVNDFKYEIEDDYVDIIEIDGASNRGIENIRELREKVMIAPTAGKYKVYIIDEVHMLTKDAFNALLKTLEEPPAHAIFIMATTDAYKVPVTITSRAQTYTFNLADRKVMFDYLKDVAKKEEIKIADDALEIVVKRGGGSFRDSLSLLDQISTLSDKEITKDMVVSVMGLPQDEKIDELLSCYLGGDVSKITNCLKSTLSSGVKAETLAEEIISKILESPKPEMLELLGRLPEVKAPFAEAKLLVALAKLASKPVFSNAGLENSGTSYTGQPADKASKPISSDAGLEFSSTSYTGAPREPSLRDEPLGHGRNIGVENSNHFKHPKETGLDASPESHTTSFDWQAFVEKTKKTSASIYLQLKRTKHELVDGDLHLYPPNKTAHIILTKSGNKRVLSDIAGENVKITIHNPDETPENETKDAVLDKFSDIMGGEVRYDTGGNPF